MADKPVPVAQSNVVDKVVGWFNPVAGARRMAARTALSSFQQATGYITGGSAKRSMRAWFPSLKSADEDTLPSHQQSVASSRDLAMNTPLALAPLKRIRTNVVGGGLVLQSRVDRKYLKLDDEAADDWERQTEREFRLWGESQFCDMSRSQTFAELQAMAMYNPMLSGDLFVALPMKHINGFPYDLRIHMIEGDRVSNPMGMPDGRQANGKNLAAGIEYDDFGAAVAYHVNTRVYGGPNLGKWTELPVWGTKSGRRNVYHLFMKDRPGQKRGMPLLAPVVEVLKQQTRLSEAALMATIIQEFFTVFVKSQGAQSLNSGFVPDASVVPRTDDGEPTNTAIPTDERTLEVGTGNILELAEGEDMGVVKAERPITAFEDFFFSYSKAVGAALEIPYEHMILHFSSSYSAARTALLEAWKFYRTSRMWLVRNFNQPVYVEWMAEAVTKGRISAPGFLTDPLARMAWSGSAWLGAGMGMIDPKKESDGAKTRVDNFFSTYEDEYIKISGGEPGGWDGMMNRRGRENKKVAALAPEPVEPAGDTPSEDPPSLEDLQDGQ
jgi:lambda family phage portal protein